MAAQRRTSSRIHPRRPRHKRPLAPLVIVTGLSGSGKGSVLKVLEDLGYYCVDNLPIELIPTFADLYVRTGEEVQRAALVVDIREGAAIESLPLLYLELKRSAAVTLVFVEAADEVLLRRFSETRRPHPLAGELSVLEGIRRERRLLRVIRAQSDIVIDTTRFSPHDLRQFIAERFAQTRGRRPLLVSLVSFGYRHGVPPDADLVFDVRFLPNPNFVPRYKPLTGKDRRVARYVFNFPQSRQFTKRVAGLLRYLLPHYIREGKSYLTIAFGCTGGRHRSVAMTEAIRGELSRSGYRAKVVHRDLAKRSSVDRL